MTQKQKECHLKMSEELYTIIQGTGLVHFCFMRESFIMLDGSIILPLSFLEVKFCLV